jgi:hypothetical protein
MSHFNRKKLPQRRKASDTFVGIHHGVFLNLRTERGCVEDQPQHLRQSESHTSYSCAAADPAETAALQKMEHEDTTRQKFAAAKTKAGHHNLN